MIAPSPKMITPIHNAIDDILPKLYATCHSQLARSHQRTRLRVASVRVGGGLRHGRSLVKRARRLHLLSEVCGLSVILYSLTAQIVT